MATASLEYTRLYLRVCVCFLHRHAYCVQLARDNYDEDTAAAMYSHTIIDCCLPVCVSCTGTRAVCNWPVITTMKAPLL